MGAVWGGLKREKLLDTGEGQLCIRYCMRVSEKDVAVCTGITGMDGLRHGGQLSTEWKALVVVVVVGNVTSDGELASTLSSARLSCSPDCLAERWIKTMNAALLQGQLMLLASCKGLARSLCKGLEKEAFCCYVVRSANCKGLVANIPDSRW